MYMNMLTAVYVANGLGLAMLLTLIYSNADNMSGEGDRKILLKLLYIAGFICVAEPLLITVDGASGHVVTAIIYAVNSGVCAAHMLIGKCWVEFIISHMNIQIPEKAEKALNGMFFFGLICIALNFFFPFIFSVEANMYRRGSFYWLFAVIAGIYMLVALLMYFKAKTTGGIFTYFPIQAFMIPVIAGVIVQTLFYGISVIGPSVVIAVTGIMANLKNEVIYSDRLTGLRNRSYLDLAQRSIQRKKNEFVTGIMIDLNGFKKINDKFGHAAGDEALIIAADIFRKTVGELGCAIRYAGDEFVILLNTVEEEEVHDFISRLYAAFDAFNESGEKPYTLSIALGYAAMDMRHQTMNDFMNTIDKKMYEDKAMYYKKSGSASGSRTAQGSVQWA